MTLRNTRIRSGTFGLAALAVVATVAPLLGPAPARGQPQAPAATQAQQALDPAVADALRRMAQALAGAPALTVRLSSLREAAVLPGSDQHIMLGATVAVGIRRPDRLAALVGSDRGSFRLWYDGAITTLLSLTANAYARAELSGDIESFLDALEDRLGVDVPLRDLLAPDPFAALTEAPTTGVHVGQTVVNGALCEQYALRNPEVDWQIWIAVGDRPVPCRLVVIDRTAPGAPRAVLEFQEWNLAPRLDDAAFRFAAPAGAQEVPWLERRAQPRPATEVR